MSKVWPMESYYLACVLPVDLELDLHTTCGMPWMAYVLHAVYTGPSPMYCRWCLGLGFRSDPVCRLALCCSFSPWILVNLTPLNQL